MRADFLPLNLPTLPDGSPTTGNGTPTRIEEYRDLAAQFVLTGTADVTVEMSFDGANWVMVPSMASITAGNTVVPGPMHAIKFVRCVVNTAYGAGDKVVMAGHIASR